MIGSVLVGKRGIYRINSKIDEGAYGVVYKGLDSDDNVVAIKILIDDKNKDAADRMIREIKIVESLNHENIIRLLDYCIEEKGASWFAMPFMRSGSLAKILSQPEKRFTPQQTLAVVRSIASGLDLYHGQGGIHRDIKPENILIDNEGVPKLADFGVARGPRFVQGNLTCSPLGTPNYMAPEAVKGDVCRQSDIYSLGIVLWELMHWKRHCVPRIPPIFEIQLSRAVVDLYTSMVHADPSKRPDAHMVAQACILLSEQLYPSVSISSTSAKNESGGSSWSWLLAAAAGLVVLGAATSNEWDGRASRYRGSNGRFRSGRWG